MSNWTNCTLGDVITVQRGHDLPETKRLLGNVPVIGSAGLTGYHDKAKAQGPGVVIGRSGNSIGAVTYVATDYWPLNTSLYVKDFKENDERFIYYFLKNMDFKALNSGSAQPSLNRNHMYPMLVKIPDLDTQIQISNILDALDNKIELNRHMNETLEQMAMALYKHWFVDFGPFQDGEFEESELGMIPNGWLVGTVADIANINMGQSPKSEFYNDKQEGLPFHQGVTNFGARFPSHSTYSSKILKVANTGDILLSVRAPVGRLNITDRDIVIGRGLASLQHKELFTSYLYYCLRFIFREGTEHGSGTIFNSINKSEIEKLKVLLPPQEVTAKFNKIAAEWDALIFSNTNEIQNLTQTRDYLLPRLLAGEIDLSAAEKKIEEVI